MQAGREDELSIRDYSRVCKAIISLPIRQIRVIDFSVFISNSNNVRIGNEGTSSQQLIYRRPFNQAETCPVARDSTRTHA